ncbi:MAG: recombinase family protein [Acutalibacteraceae bacterium]
MYIAVYPRKSKFRKDSISIESQIEFCKHEIKEGEKFKVYADNGFSGKDTNREQFQLMCKDIENGLISKVVVYKLDRISRSIIDFANIMEFFGKHNVEFVSCTEKFDTSTPMGRAMLNICIIFAQLERETIQQRITDTYHSRNKKGFYMGGGKPYGFDLEKIEINDRKSKKYVPIDKEIEGVKLIYSMYSQPNVTLGDILNYLNNSHIPSKKGGRWCLSSLMKILASPIYVKADIDIYNFYKDMGANVINIPEDFNGINACYTFTKKKDESTKLTRFTDISDQELVLAPHEGIISSDLWLKCRKKQFANRRSYPLSTKKGKKSWLVGKVKCSKCSCAFCVYQDMRLRKNGQPLNSKRIFKCSGYTVHKCCDVTKKLSVDEIEDYIFNEMKNKLQEFKEIHSNKQTLVDPKLNQYKMQLVKVNNEIDELLSKIIGSNKTLMNYINNKIEELDREKQRLQEEILVLSADSKENNICKITNYMDNWDEIEIQDKLFTIDSLISVIVISENDVKIKWKI